ncbi:MAG: threonine synthase [Candidatus Stygibacter australis]|nr:threonine synthase [Candidatus Stygibacter australis]MDP8321561.1 threonine synthase [Candidatus Stygibacter australis]
MRESIKYYSTNLKAAEVSFRDALLKGIAPDRGLFMPKEIPSFSADELTELASLEYYEIASAVLYKFLKGEIPQTDLLNLARSAYNYEVPLEHVFERKYVMRLDQGPTASFKDFAARMMGRLMQYYLKTEDRKLLILTATSGDTGSAIANAFYGLDNIKCLVLFPEKEVTDRQRKQMTTLGKNIQIVGLNAKFDDCQHLVKQAFADTDLDFLNLSSANSINIGRILPQIVYYFYAYAKLKKGADDKVIYSVPSGNFGDMMGGMIASRMGLPVKKYVIACNENDEFPVFLKTGQYRKIVPSKNCLSSAMNVGHPSNLSRLVALYGGAMDEKGNVSKAPDLDRMRKDIFAVSVNDKQTKEMIAKAYQQHKLLLEPHGAVGWSGLEYFLETHPDYNKPEQLCVSLETAHPAKFPQQIEEILKFDPELPPSLEGLEEKEESFDLLKNEYDAFKEYLIRKYK